MDKEALRYLYTRSREEHLHLQAVRNDSSKLTHDVGKLVDTVFAHLPAQFASQEPPAYPEGEASARIPSTEWIAWHFYNDHYCSPTLHRDFHGVEVDISKFLTTLTAFGASRNRNNLFFLQGDIGSGKTAFVNYLITKYGTHCFDKRRTWFLRLNVDTIDHTQKDPVAPLVEFFEKSSDKLIRVLRKMCAEDLSSVYCLSENQIARIGGTIGGLTEALASNGTDQLTRAATLRSAFSKAVKEASDTLSRRLLLILDNLDAFFHERDRYLFLSNVDTGEDVYVRAIQNIVSEFYHGNGDIGDLGVNVIFVLRPDSYEILKSSKLIYQGSEDSYKDNRSLFTLHTPDWKDIILERSNLLNLTVQNISKTGTRREVDRALEDVVTALADGRRVQNIIHHLQSIVTFGLRSVMNFFQQYTWLNTGDEEALPTTRYIQNIPIGLICFILQNRRLFSQKESGFPNVYYINVDEDESRDVNSDITAILDGEKLNPSHSHTYWLKRLMLLFIQQRNDMGAKVQTLDVVDTFSPTHGGYDRGLVRLCLGSFSQTHLSNLCLVKRQLSNDKRRLVVGDIVLTDRARYCIEHLFDRFAYLQLIIDDHDLPLPKGCAKKFKYSLDRNYGYLVKEGEEYARRSEDMVKNKASQVTKFLALLTEAYDVESFRYDTVFRNLAVDGVRMPNPDENVASFFRELRALQSFPMSHNPARNVDINGLSAQYQEWRAILRPQLESAYGF